MAKYTINIESSPGHREASPEIIVFAAGDTVTFATDSHGSNLCLSAATAAILSPAPASLSIPIAKASSVSFTFQSAAAGEYDAQVMPEAVPCQTIKGVGVVGGAVLVVLPGSDPGYDGGDAPPGN